jgi:hypothetical protein
MITQFTTVLIINKFYFNNNTYISDIVAFFIILLGFLISFFNLFSKALNIPIESQSDKNSNNNDNDNDKEKKIE